jgi:hypothetical protein
VTLIRRALSEDAITRHESVSQQNLVGTGRIASGFRFSIDANCRSLPYATSDFLSNWVALAIFMRLSLLKAAHAAASECRVAGNPSTLRSG